MTGSSQMAQALVEAFLKSEAEQTVRDLGRHVGDEVHAVLKRHGMTMKTTAGAIGVGVLAAAQVLGDTLEFARRSTDGDAADELLATAAVAKLFADVAAPDLCLTAAPAATPVSIPAGWQPISEARARMRYMGAFRMPLQPDRWNIVGPGSVRDGVFHDHLGDWPGIDRVFHLPPCDPTPKPVSPAADQRARLIDRHRPVVQLERMRWADEVTVEQAVAFIISAIRDDRVVTSAFAREVAPPPVSGEVERVARVLWKQRRHPDHLWDSETDPSWHEPYLAAAREILAVLTPETEPQA